MNLFTNACILLGNLPVPALQFTIDHKFTSIGFTNTRSLLYSFQLVGAEQRVLRMLLVKDRVDGVASASKLQLLQGHSEEFALDQCFKRERHPFSVCSPCLVQYSLPWP